ncbi:MAG: hypothetical protein RQ722_10875, partial [Desulfuromonadales bacterium]|nr:hypothetical protein [Desulfuromonadales bacterium]
CRTRQFIPASELLPLSSVTLHYGMMFYNKSFFSFSKVCSGKVQGFDHKGKSNRTLMNAEKADQPKT